MKTIPPSCPEPQTGPKYWRSLDDLADTPEFRQWVEREFPAGASELTDPVTRRSFVKLMSASFLLAGFGLAGSGCRRPVENIYPFSKMPEGYVHGVPKFFATSMPVRRSAIPLLAKSNDGRPTKLEGNPLGPDGSTGTDRYAQASILNLYDPDRATRFLQNGIVKPPSAAMDALKSLADAQKTSGGKGLAILAEQSSSPTRARLQKLIADKLPQSHWYEYEPVDFDVHRQAATISFGQSVAPMCQLDAASVIVSLDSDFLGNEEHLPQNIRGFAAGRRQKSATDPINRLYIAEAMLSLTGANADHRLRIAASQIPAVAAALAAAVLGSGQVSDAVSTLAGSVKVDPKWISECAKDLLANKGKCVVLAGSRQPLTVHLLANAMNAALGNIGKTVVYLDSPAPTAGSISDLAQQIKSGAVDTLVVLGANPVYNAPVDLDWAKLQEKLNVIRLSYYEDESTPKNGWSIPQAHFLETWGDARTADGTLVPIQPLIEPLFGGISEIELLARLTGMETPSAYDLVRETFKGIKNGEEEAWKEFLYSGFLKDSAAKPVSVQLNPAAVASAIKDENLASVPPPTKDKLEVIFHRDYKMDDGRFNNNGWMQELPDPITKMTWENVIMMSLKTANELGVYIPNRENNRIKTPRVKITLDGREIEGPVWAQPGQADNTIALALGYGRTYRPDAEKKPRVGYGAGYNAYALRTTKNLHCGPGATLKSTGENLPLSVTQDHGAMEGRPIIREATVKEYQDYKQKHSEGNFALGYNMERPEADHPELYPNPFDTARLKGHHQWGMVIDLSTCVGCSSCMVACQSENNVPIVGKDQVANNREMHWIRIDRYFTGDPEKEDSLQVINQPMLCQHCEAAPCENVCPVNATTHDQEGLNVMVYNRCVGTRYCSNNCPYKVRRFNFFDYNRRPLDQLKGPVYTSPLSHKTDGELDLLRWWKDPDRGNKPSDEWDMLKLAKNPDVTVRMRGVMEKCSYCLQRIEGAKIAKKVKAGQTGDVILSGNEVPKTACQQACPAEAIVFGNIEEQGSSVAQQKASDRNYSVLDFLNTKPRTTYLAKIRNPNPAMPDAYAKPNSTEEFEMKSNVDPFEAEEKGHAKMSLDDEGLRKGAI